MERFEVMVVTTFGREMTNGNGRRSSGRAADPGLCRLVGLMAAVALAVAAGDARANAASMIKGPLPPPDAAVASVGDVQAYQIAPADTLQIEVFNVDSLNRQVQVDSSGRIDFPLIGGVVAARKTAPQLAAEIAGRLQEKYLQSPRVTVFVKQSATRRFTVEGAVKSPGVFDWGDRVTLLQAMAQAKGAEPSARVDKVLIFRTVQQKRVAGVYNLEDIRSGKVDDPDVYPDDVIVVADSKAQRAFQRLLSATPLFYFMPH